MTSLYSEIVSQLKIYTFSVLLCIPLVMNAQVKDELYIVEADSSWGKEIIKFPIDWAPKMNVKGFEELRFAPQWSNKEHEDFWSLVMAWKITASTKLSLAQLKLNLESYFDGLMKPNHWASDFPEPKLFFFDSVSKGNNISFKGRLDVFDGFHTGQSISLNIVANQHFCKTTESSIIVFRFSPKEYTEPIWNQLKEITIKDHVCED